MKQLLIFIFCFFISAVNISAVQVNPINELKFEIMDSGGEIELIQGRNSEIVKITRNGSNVSTVIVTNTSSGVVVEQYDFTGNNTIVIDKSRLANGNYRLVATAGSNSKTKTFDVNN